jgi:energy-coupling factor transporter ATP-binding protein EcfA2
MSAKRKYPKLVINNLGPIRRAEVEFGDLTVLVGPQASGKSVLLQMLKLVTDYRSVAATLRKHGYALNGDGKALMEVFFGEGMDNLWKDDLTKVSWKGDPVNLSDLTPGKVHAKSPASLFYIPAHRVLAFQNGWPRHFGAYSAGDPYVVEDFSEQLRLLMESGLGRGEAIFPQAGRLTEATRKLLKRGIFGDFALKQDQSGPRKRLVLQRKGESALPFMVWSAGQREFTPLLLGLYHLMPSAGAGKRKPIDWVVLEEPEMGLHPRAIESVLWLVMELLERGYRVCISTHSPHVLDLVWALRVFKDRKSPPESLLKLFHLPPGVKTIKVAESVLQKRLKVYYFDREAQATVDISRLDPNSAAEAENSWGGFTTFSSHAADVVAGLETPMPGDSERDVLDKANAAAEPDAQSAT